MGRTTSSTSRRKRKQSGADGHGSAAEATLQALQEKRCVSFLVHEALLGMIVQPFYNSWDLKTIGVVWVFDQRSAGCPQR